MAETGDYIAQCKITVEGHNIVINRVVVKSDIGYDTTGVLQVQAICEMFKVTEGRM